MMKSRTRRTTLLIVIVLFCISAGNFALAQQDQIISAYKQFIDITAPNIIVPTVVNVPFASISVDRPEFAVLNQSQNTFEPHYFKHTRGSAIPISISSNSYAGNHQAMIDNQPRTFTEFALPEELEGTAVITVQASQRIESSELKLMLDDHVALPSFIEIRANSADLQQIVVAKTRLNSTTVQFPKTSAQTWVIQLTYIQPLRVNELQLRQENQGIPEQAVRFLAQPNMSYRIYFNPDRFAAPNVGESADLVNDQDVLALQATTSQKNPLYIPADIDSDGIPDRLDSCVSVTNQDQVDINQNGRGDVCDDFDKDGVINSADNCIDLPNRAQRDDDGDGEGDVCDGRRKPLYRSPSVGTLGWHRYRRNYHYRTLCADAAEASKQQHLT